MTDQSRRLVLAQRPSGMVDDAVVRLETVDVPEPGPGEAVVQVSHLSIDPTIRTWMDDAPGYLPPIEIDAVIRSGGLGTVVASQNERFPVGATIFGMLGWQEHAVIDDTPGGAQVVPDGLDPTAVLSVFGVTGMTAYFGLLDIGQPKEGDVVVVSGAAGATGSVVGQIAKIKGASKVVGIAGGPEKCAWLVDELGFDAAIDYKDGPVGPKLRELCPDGIDIYFDNVGGEILDAALANIAQAGTIVMCGGISTGYTIDERPPGVHNLSMITVRSARMEGFIVLNYMARFGEAVKELATWVQEGKISWAEDVQQGGIEQAPATLRRLFEGKNFGKQLLQLAEPSGPG